LIYFPERVGLYQNFTEKIQALISSILKKTIKDLQEIRGNRFEKLKGDRKGQYSIRINDQYRICFRWEKENVVDTEIIDYHF